LPRRPDSCAALPVWYWGGMKPKFLSEVTEIKPVRGYCPLAA
jgi:hypothetical protein